MPLHQSCMDVIRLGCVQLVSCHNMSTKTPGNRDGKEKKGKKHLPANSSDVCGYFLFFVIEGGRAQNSLVASRCFTCVCNMPDNVRFGLVIERKHRFGLTFMKLKHFLLTKKPPKKTCLM